MLLGRRLDVLHLINFFTLHHDRFKNISGSKKATKIKVFFSSSSLYKATSDPFARVQITFHSLFSFSYTREEIFQPDDFRHWDDLSNKNWLALAAIMIKSVNNFWKTFDYNENGSERTKGCRLK